jgi:hypothetical protein
MSPVNIKEILQRHGKGERPNVDFKRELDLTSTLKKVELAKDIAAMCELGGYILFGFENDGRPLGIDPVTFDEEQISQVIANRCLYPSHGIAAELIDYEENGINYTVGVISVPESSFELPTCFKDKNGNWKAPVRVGSTTSYLTPTEAIEYYKAKRKDRPPKFLPIDIDNAAVYSLDFSDKNPYLSFRAKPLESFGEFMPSIPIPLSFVPQLYRVKPVLKCWCGSIAGEDWLSRLLEVEQKIREHHSGIIAETWGIRNWELIGPLPNVMEYFIGPSIVSLKETVEELEIRKYSYFGWAAVAFKQILYVCSGQMNHLLDLDVYLPYVPKSNEFVSVSSSGVTTERQNLWFSEVDGIDIADFSGIRYWSTDYPTKEDLMKLPSARIAGYMGSPRSDDTFKIKGLHVLALSEDCREIVKDKGGKYGEFISSIERGTLPSYVDSKLVERESDEVKLTHLRMNVQFFSGTFSTVHLLSVRAGIHQT